MDKDDAAASIEARALGSALLEEIAARGIELPEEDRTGLERLEGPKDDDELWEAVHALTGYKVPRVAVCPGHVAPFTVFADMYFERRADVLCIGNRGGGKTTISGFLHGAKCRWHPGYKSAVAGAVEKQGQRAYAEFKRFIRHIASEVVDTLQSNTEFVNASVFEVLGGTIKALNGPHPHLAQFDEVELTGRLEFEEFQNMAQGDTNHQAQNLLTSTRKTPGGLVQQIADENEEAEAEGVEAPWDILTFCVFETMAKVPNCGNGCGCDKVVKGRWMDGTPRSFASVCDGRGRQSDGFVQLRDVQKRFRRLSRYTWEAQQECLRPNVEGLVHYWFDLERHGIDSWTPFSKYGPVYRSWDWGGTNPHAVLFHQVLHVPVELPDGRVLGEGSIVTFDEVYYPGGSFRHLASRVFDRANLWHDYGYEWDVAYDFCDPAGATAKEDVKDCARDSEGEYPMPTFRNIPASIEESLEKHVSKGEDDELYVVKSMCPNTVREYGLYMWPEQKKNKNKPTVPVDKDNHAMDAKRYLIWNLWRLSKQHGGEEAPGSRFDQHAPQQLKEAERKDSKRGKNYNEMPVGSDAGREYLSRDPKRSQSQPTVRRQVASPSVRR